MKLFRISIFFLLLILTATCKPVSPAPVLTLQDGWVRAVPPGMSMTAAYGSFTNHGMDAIEIVSFSSDSFTDVSLHQTTMENGISKMEQVSDWSLSPGTRTVLKPGGLHLMLMDPAREIRPGDSIGLTLIAANGEQYRFSLAVGTH